MIDDEQVLAEILSSYNSAMPGVVYRSLVAQLAVAMKSGDPSFDEIEFYEACGVACAPDPDRHLPPFARCLS